eukprot:Hpha_TRINITY_DN15178_c4_g4::TRINITY_DN15178_c4_g4_i1::g.129689::m.129689
MERRDDPEDQELVNELAAAVFKAKPATEEEARVVVRDVLARRAASTPARFALDASPADARAMFIKTGDAAVRFLEGLPQKKVLTGVSYPDADLPAAAEGVADLIEETPPEGGTDYDELLAFIFERCLSSGIDTAHPGYMGHIGGGGIVPAACADFVSDLANRQMAVWICCPAFVRLEMNVLRWFCDMAGLPRATSLGALTTGGSLATLSAVVSARSTKVPVDTPLQRCRIYVSEHSHHCVAKATRVAGFPPQCKREIPCAADATMDVDKLREAVAQDKAEGLLPFLVVPTAGTTDTGAVDPLEDIAAFCKQEGLWMHVDAAYGFFYLLDARGKKALRGIEHADSIALDPHKGLGLPYGTGCLLVRNLAQLEQGHESARGNYMPPAAESAAGGRIPDLVDFSSGSPELSREFRGLRVWLPLKMHGLGPFRQQIQENIENVLWAEEELKKVEEVEIITRPVLSILTFALRALEGEAVEGTNARTRELLKTINDKGDIFVTPTLVHGRFVVRLCVNNFKTHRKQVESLVEAVRRGAPQHLK